ncbi:high affinity immunoglobulin epsilon receptor subunit beta isoform X2 [Carlito syrichta]|uniref:high affinity immunoglobulin epsilon receptor subunit beta isoform X2 n=1 Tax=Carlito syrichta TaxID=1868482 RepID=UPI00046B2C24|nr:high affinity immunoglobulin epsilon receptor subunit beta isoform X2 [Carlito syrichta]
MDMTNRSRADLALPSPQESSSVPESELTGLSPRDNASQRKSASSPPQHTWLTFLKKELEFLGFSISGFLSIISENKNAIYLTRGRLGANTVSSIAGGTGIVILIINLKKSSAYIDICQTSSEIDGCFLASFSTEIVVMILFLTILGFCSAVSLTIYGVGEELKENKVPDDRLYEELNIYSTIYSELEEREEMSPPTEL